MNDEQILFEELKDAIKKRITYEKAKAETENAMCGKHRYAWKLLEDILNNND